MRHHYYIVFADLSHQGFHFHEQLANQPMTLCHQLLMLKQMFQQMREEYITALAIYERQTPEHIGRQLRRENIKVDPAIEHVRAAADMQL
jgi:hypothetical protein